MMEECKNCKYYAWLYVPPLNEYESIPKNAFVCTYFLRSDGQVMYLGNGKGMCECFTERKVDAVELTDSAITAVANAVRETLQAKARWERKKSGLVCSWCGYAAKPFATPFCPNCGMKMEE